MYRRQRSCASHLANRQRTHTRTATIVVRPARGTAVPAVHTGSCIKWLPAASNDPWNVLTSTSFAPHPRITWHHFDVRTQPRERSSIHDKQISERLMLLYTTYPPSRRTVRRSVMFNVCKNVIVRKHYPNLINEFHIYLPCTTRWVAQVMFSRRLYMLYCVNMLLCLYVYYGVRMAVSKIKAKRLKWSSSKSRPYDI